ncbi:MAG: hypothetical protein ACRD47_10870 [Nitrososphaeraceae archaeon]
MQWNCNEKESTGAKRVLPYTLSMQPNKQIENETTVGNKFFMNVAPVGNAHDLWQRYSVVNHIFQEVIIK